MISDQEKPHLPGNRVMVRNFITIQILEANELKSDLFGAAKLGYQSDRTHLYYQRFLIKFYNLFENVFPVFKREYKSAEAADIERLEDFFNKENLCCYSPLKEGLDIEILRQNINEAMSTYDTFINLATEHKIYDPTFTAYMGQKNMFDESVGW